MTTVSPDREARSDSGSSVPAARAPRAPAAPLRERLLLSGDLVARLERIRNTHGDVVWIPIFGRLEVLAFLGAEGLECALLNKDGAYSSRLGWERYVDHVFPGAIMAMDGKDHRYHRRLLQEAFTRPNLEGYVEQMNPIIGRRIESLATTRHVKLYPFVKSLTLDVATQVFMGMAPGRDSDRLNRAFIDAVDASIALLRLPVWPLPYYRGLRGRALLGERFGGLVNAKRQRPAADLFSKLCQARSEDGEAFTDEEVVNHMVFVMMAAHDTSTSTLATAVYHLAKHPEWQERLREESRQRPAQLSLEELEQLEELGWVVEESLRLFPPLAVMPRVTATRTEHGGYSIPPGVLIGLAPALVHRDPRHWSRPHHFDPARFSPSRAEDKRHAFAFAPFGGGRHICVGKRFGQLEIRSTLHQMLRRVRWSVPDGYQMPFRFVPIAKPRDGLPLTITAL